MLLVLGLMTAAGCWRAGERDVVVYTALDQEFSETIFERYQRASGDTVLPKFDTESTKTVALAEAIIAERGRPRCDVFWNNEILNTLRLEKLGLLEAYSSPRADDYPAMYRSPRGHWHGFAARARVLLVNTNLVSQSQRPTSIRDLGDPRWRGRTGIAKPLFGTTATHAACLFAALGDQPAREFFRQLKHNRVQILSGNRPVARQVGVGNLAFGLTDTDDAVLEINAGSPVVIVYPDQGEGELGTLFIPNTVAIIKGCPHPDAARRLVDHLLSPEVETLLSAGPSAQIPLGRHAEQRQPIKSPGEVRAMRIDLHDAADWWETAAGFIRDEFTAD